MRATPCGASNLSSMANDTTATKPAKKAAPRKAAKKAAPAPAAKTRTPRKAAKKTTTAPPAPPPGWYLDPTGDPTDSLSRYWDGKEWLGDPIPTAMVDPTDQPTTTLADATTYDVATETVTFRGRTMKVVQPEPEQLVVWQLTVRRLEGIESVTTTEQATTLIGRALRVIQSVLANDVDRDWVEDQILDKKLDLTGAVPIVITALTMFNEKRTAAQGNNPAAAGKKPGTARRRR